MDWSSERDHEEANRVAFPGFWGWKTRPWSKRHT